MRRGGLLLVLACAAVAGCFTTGKRPSVPEIVRSLAPPVDPDGIIVESVLVEQPVGDHFLDHTLWTGTLPVGGPETRALLDENGLRVGILTGNGPQKFQTLLESDTDTVSPQRITFQLRKDAVLPTAGPTDPCRFAVRTDLGARPRSLDLKQARSGVYVRPELAPDGRVKVSLEPQVQHGERQWWLRPNEDGTSFARHDEVATEKFPVLGCEATLGPDDYLIVGWEASAAGTLGSVLFSADANGRARQRVLVIRTRTARPQPAQDLPPIANPLKRPAIASEAGQKR